MTAIGVGPSRVGEGAGMVCSAPGTPVAKRRRTSVRLGAGVGRCGGPEVRGRLLGCRRRVSAGVHRIPDPAFASRRTGTPVVVPSPIVVRLTVALAVVVAVAAAMGLFTGGGPGPHAVLTARGQGIHLYGIGLYRYDSWLIGVGNRGTDAVTMFLGLPVLLAALIGYRRRSLRSSIVLIGVLGWLLYCYASTSLYTAYNRLFGLYVVALGLALFAVPLALWSIDPVRFAADFP